MRMIRIAQWTMLFLVLALLVQSVSANPFYPSGSISGDCHAYATVNMTVYDDGFRNNAAHIVDTSSMTADINGDYAITTASILTGGVSYDYNITATNPTCSPGVRGSIALDLTTSSGPAIPVPVPNTDFTMKAPFALVTPATTSIVGDNHTVFDWNSDYLNVNFTLQIAPTSAFATLLLNLSGITTSGVTLTSAQELPDATYYWRVLAYNGTDFIDTSSTFSYTLSTQAAELSGLSPSNNSFTNETTNTISFTTDKSAFCAYASTAGVAYASKTQFTTTGGTSHSGSITISSEGANSIYIQCETSTNVLGGNQLYLLNLDTTDPVSTAATVIINNGDAYSLDTTLTLNWSGFTDAGSGLYRYYYSFTNGGGTLQGTSTSNLYGTLSDSAQGTVSVYVWARDNVNNIGLAKSDSIIVDSLSPSFSQWTGQPTDLTKYSSGNYRVNMTISDTSGLASTPTIRYRIGSDSWTNWSTLTLRSQTHTTQYNYFYTYTFVEQDSPNTWFERSDENLTYEIYVEDILGHNNTITRNEYINELSTQPILATIPSMTATEEVEHVFNISATDLDLNTLTYDCNVSNSTVTKLTNTLAEVRWEPSNGQEGTKVFSCNVTDEIFYDSQTFTISVTNVNDKPELTAVGSLYAQEYSFFNYTLNASDEDNDVLRFISNSTIFTVNSQTGKFSFTPFMSQRGNYRINFTVDDQQGGIDFESVLFTVGYCGDNTCRTGYETCNTCEVDCGLCSDEESKTLLIDSRNCVNDEMTTQAVKLVQRGTCEEKGVIVDGLEACDPLASNSISLYKELDDGEYELIESKESDELGYVSFTPSEIGFYQVRFGSSTENAVSFEVDSCLGVEKDTDTPATNNTNQRPPTDTPLPPLIEEPGSVDEGKGNWNFLSVFLYFVVSPLLLIILIISSLGYVYKLERQKKHSHYVDTVDQWMKIYRASMKSLESWMEKTVPFNHVLRVAKSTKEQVLQAWETLLPAVENQWYTFIGTLGFKRKLALPYMRVPAGDKQLAIMIVSLIKYYHAKADSAKTLDRLYEYAVQSILDVAALLMSFGIKIRMLELPAQNPKYLGALMHKGLRYEQKSCTRADIDSSLQAGNPVVCALTMQNAHQQLERSIVVVYGYDSSVFFFHNYKSEQQQISMSKEEFMRALQLSGSSTLFLEK